VTISPPPAPATARTGPDRATAARTTGRVLVVLAVAAVIIAGHLWYGNRHDYFDLRIYHGAVVDWAHGGRLYDYFVMDRYAGPLGFTYPPFAALLMYPMAGLGIGATITVTWIASALALLALLGWLLVPVADRHGLPRWYLLGLAVPLCTWLEPVRETVTFGQVNLLLAALVVGDLLLLVGRGYRFAGVGVGLAAAVKLTPAIFIVYLLVARRFRAAAVAAGTAVAASAAAAAFRFDDSWQYWTSVLWQTGRVGDVKKTPNQSLLGALSRLFDPHPAPRWLWLALVLLVLGVGLARAAQAARVGDEVAGLTLAGLVGCLVSPVSWQHHLVWFVPALVVLVDAGLPVPGAVPEVVSGVRPGRAGHLAIAAAIWATVSYSLIAWYDWHLSPRHDIHTPWGNLIGAWDTVLMLALLVALPVRRLPRAAPVPVLPLTRRGRPAAAPG
jgi:alpha-1,2-mannosyltransferase